VKKMLICCGALCMTMLLFCVSAFAAVDVKSSDGTVTVTVNETAEKGPEITVSKKSGVDAENLYLVMVQEGTELPTSENLYYMDVDKFSAAFDMKAYPKDGFLTAGKTYTVYLSDWSTANNGGRKAVATLTVGDNKPVNQDDPPSGEYQCGDVNHSGGNPDNIDLIILARYVGEWPAYMKEGALDLALGDVNASGGNPDNIDLLILARYVGEWPGYTSLPRK